jgi:hypothetical protein
MEKRHPNHPGVLSSDAQVAETKREKGELNARGRAIQVLTEAGVPFVVGGAYAYCQYTGIYRDTKDLDLFPRPRDADAALKVLAADGWRTERTDPVWLYKGFKGEWFVDLIFSSGNGVAEVEGQSVLIAPPEELIWSKAFVQERERFDGADVIHLLQWAGPEMDWVRLLRRFDRYWEVLFAHLMLFRFSYPGERNRVPDWVMRDLLARASRTVDEGNWDEKLCRGNLLSKVNYSLDLSQWGYRDGRKWDERERAAGPELEAASGGVG